jgi:ribonuclease HI
MQLRSRYGIPDWSFDQIPKTLRPINLFNIDKASFSLGTLDCEDDQLQVFADGSRTDSENISGYGTAIKYQNQFGYYEYSEKCYNSGPVATVYQAEAAAIGDAALDVIEFWLDKPPVGEKKVTIFVDNQAILYAMQSRYISSATVLDAIQKLNMLGKDSEITIKWIRAHVGHEGNEIADQLANCVAKLKAEDVHPLLPVSKAALYMAIKKEALSIWQTRWDRNIQCRMSKIMWPTINKGKSMQLLQWSRHEYSIAVRHITGFSWTRYHRWKCSKEIGIFVPKLCRLCSGEEESSYHIIMECPRLMSLRRDCFGLSILPTTNYSQFPQIYPR